MGLSYVLNTFHFRKSRTSISAVMLIVENKTQQSVGAVPNPNRHAVS